MRSATTARIRGGGGGSGMRAGVAEGGCIVVGGLRGGAFAGGECVMVGVGGGTGGIGIGRHGEKGDGHWDGISSCECLLFVMSPSFHLHMLAFSAPALKRSTGDSREREEAAFP